MALVLRGVVKPRMFSWLIWGVTTEVVGWAQFFSGRGAGSWPTIVSGMLSLIISFLAYYKNGISYVKRSDFGILVFSLSAIPLWYFTKNPLIAVIILTVIDSLGMLPTLRKCFYFPWEESLSTFCIVTCRDVFALMALTHYSMTTLFFPIVTGFNTLFLIVVLLYRRFVIPFSARNS